MILHLGKETKTDEVNNYNPPKKKEEVMNQKYLKKKKNYKTKKNKT